MIEMVPSTGYWETIEEFLASTVCYYAIFLAFRHILRFKYRHFDAWRAEP